jgi:hypothetical protein
MRDWLLLAGFGVCVVIGVVTVLWPQLSTPDDPTQSGSVQSPPPRNSAPK